MSEVKGSHPYADRFPMLPDDELDALAASIAESGQRLPIIVDADGLILDGRNRHAACQLVGVEPKVEVYEGDDIADYIIEANDDRRHMTSGARAMSRATLLSADGRRKDGRWIGWSRTSQNLGKSSGETESMRRCGIVIDFAPELADEVIFHGMPLDRAYQEACDRRDAERQKLAEEERLAAVEAEAREFIEANDRDLAAMVGDTLQTYAEAQAIWDQRHREQAERMRREKAEQEKHERQARQARTDLYSGIAKNIELFGVYGRYPDVDSVMAEYNPAELSPTSLASAFEPAALADAKRFIDRLIQWSQP